MQTIDRADEVEMGRNDARGDIGEQFHFNNQVTRFVESVRREQQQSAAVTDSQNLGSEVNVPGFEDAKGRAERAIIEAEKFKASIVEPPGKNLQYVNFRNDGDSHVVLSKDLILSGASNNTNGSMLSENGSGMSDDDFFHLTCHIDPSLMHKIEKGEFGELERLLPKDRLSGNGDTNRLEWIQQDGATFLAPATKQSKIGSIRRWEQAFRAYATIYCAANPRRSKEIWQYISVINTAAASYVWDNVYNYDITFRHLMAFNPNRSWAVTYNQMWNLSMKEPLPRNVAPGRNYSSFGNGFGNNQRANQDNRNYNNNVGHGGARKPQYCWGFNRGIKCKFGKNCKYIERCKYCDSPSHGINVCPKVNDKTKSPNNGNAGNNGSNANGKGKPSN